MNKDNQRIPGFRVILFTFIVLTQLSFPAFAVQSNSVLQPQKGSDSLQLAKKLQSVYGKLISLEFDFTQLTRTSGRERHGSGNAVFYRTGDSQENNVVKNSIMRWNYTRPDQQIIINDGENITIYTEKDKQLLKTSAEELESDITYAFLSGAKRLLDDFVAEKPTNRFSFSIPGKTVSGLQLIPRKPHSQVKAVHLWFDNNFLIRNLIIEDHFDSVTELNFTNILRDNISPNNAKKVAEIINFSIPPGTEIISQ